MLVKHSLLKSVEHRSQKSIFYFFNIKFLLQEIDSFNSCFKGFRAKQAKQKAFEESGELPVGKLPVGKWRHQSCESRGGGKPKLEQNNAHVFVHQCL